MAEDVPYECVTPEGGYTCLGDCKKKLPDHCDRYVKSVSKEHLRTTFSFRLFVPSNVSYPHTVNVVGYGVDSDGWAFWTLKNSWGSNWGEYGYMRLFRGLGHCGVGSYNSQPICSSYF